MPTPQSPSQAIFGIGFFPGAREKTFYSVSPICMQDV